MGGIAGVPDRATVLVVGGGPVGLAAAALLDRLAVDTVVVERRDGAQVPPAAHVVNARTFEVLRAAGVDGDRIEAACQRPEDGAWVRWVTELVGDELAAVPFERQGELDWLDAVTPTPLRNLSQSRLEPILRDHVDGCPLATGVDGIEWIGAHQDGDGVTSTVRDVASGATTEIRSSWVIAADGARSAVRRALGIEMCGPERLAAFVTIHLEGSFRGLLGDRPATLYWVDHPDHPGIFVAHDLDSTLVFMHPFDPDVERLADYPAERCLALAEAAAGVALPATVRSISPWSMSCQVAARYREGRLFLAGDAAHRFPPSGGLGLNTGVVDVQNLAWKLAAVHAGWADPTLLDSYEAERRPVAEANGGRSLDNALRMAEVHAALGLTGDREADREAYRAALATPAGRGRVRRAAEAQAGHFDQLGLQLGFRHGGDGPPVADDVRRYAPSTEPGARLPHAWVEDAATGRRISTLDLVPLDRFVLLTSSPAWARAGIGAATAAAAPLEVVLVGRDVLDPDACWAAVGAIGEHGALVVRPDQHVAARWPAEPGAAAAAELVDVLAAATAAPGAARSDRLGCAGLPSEP